MESFSPGWLQDPKHVWLLVVFFTYLLVILIYSVIYYLLYQHNPGFFLANMEITESRKDEIDRHVSSLTDQVEIMQLFYDYLSDDQATTEMESTTGPGWHLRRSIVAKTANYTLAHLYSWSELGYARGYTHSLQVLGDENSQLFSWGKPLFEFWGLPSNEKELQEIVGRVLSRLESQLKSFSRRSERWDLRHPTVWTYIDFLYFSTITQTTVGYGDILPNSTIVRIFVMSQALLGIALLVVVINLSFNVIGPAL